MMLKQETDASSDDTYGFNDEEFLALAEADIGRPIGEGDLGRPIDHKEGTSSKTSKEEQGAPHDSVPQARQQMGIMKRSLSREAAIAAALQAHAGETERTGTESTTSSKPAAKASTGAPGSTVANGGIVVPLPAPTTGVSTVSKSSSNSSCPSLPPEQAKKTLSSLNYQRYLQSVRERQQNQNQLTSEKGDQKSQSGSVPSTSGGFNFPPGTVFLVYACLLL